MNTRHPHFVWFVCLTLVCSSTQAGTVSWDDGALFNHLWSFNNNWDPNGSPAGCDVTIGDLAPAMGDETLIDGTFAVSSLTILNGSGVVNSPDGGTTDFELQVNGLASVQSGGYMTLYGGAADALDTEQLEIVDGTVTLDSLQPAGLARIEIESGAASSLDIQSNGLLTGNGRIDLEGSPASATRLLRNNGTLTAGAVGFNPIVVPATTLQITALDADARVDLDGTGGENGVVNVNKNATLDIDVAMNDDFNGELNLRSGSTFDTEVGAGMITDTGANVNVTTTGTLGQLESAARMVGGSFQMRGGTLTLASANDTLIFDNSMVGSSGTIANSGHLIFNDSGLIFLDFQMNGNNASITVGENASLQVTDQDFNLDGDGASTNVTTIESGGRLFVGLNDLTADDSFNHTININGGELEVTNDADNVWAIGGLLNDGTLNAGGAATSTLLGDELQVFGEINVLADSQLDVLTDGVVFTIGTDIDIESGGVLNVNGSSKWVDSGIAVTGAGQLRPGMFEIGGASPDNVVWNAAQVDLDDGGSATIRAGSSLTVNSDTIDPDDGKFSQDMFIEDGAQLIINQTGGGEAIFGMNSTLTVDGNSTFFDSSNGTAIRFQGSMEVNGDAESAGRLILEDSSVNINDPNGHLQFSGGTQSIGNTNKIEAASISGSGQVRIASTAALRGFGRIDPDVNGFLNAQLIAEGGQLNINGAIQQIGTIGTNGSGGWLNVANSWNTNVANVVRLNDGRLRGGTITNDNTGGINGFGIVDARVINNTRIDAEGGTLVLDNDAIDYDGAADTGALNAISGDLEVIDNAAFAFGGTVRANNGREVFANGFSLNYRDVSSMELLGGTFRSTNDTTFEGALTTSVATSRLEVPQFTFAAGSTAALGGLLRLNNDATVVESGAAFSGGGGVLNPAGSELQLLDGAAVDVLLQNEGLLTLGASPGQTTGLDFQQTVDGTLDIELQGTALTDYDRMSLTGLAALDGELAVSLLGGFLPTLGDTFTILSAAGGVSGSFSTLDLPAIGGGLGWNVNYAPTLVELVVAQLTGDPDFNMDGALDCLDVDALVAEIAAGMNTALYDLTGDGAVDGADLDQWLVDAGAANLASGNPYLAGDANLDGFVDGQDFVEWNTNKFTSTAAWCSADFNADGLVDGQDFVIWNDNKFMAADGQLSAVPEPAAGWLMCLCASGLIVSRMRRLG